MVSFYIFQDDRRLLKVVERQGEIDRELSHQIRPITRIRRRDKRRGALTRHTPNNAQDPALTIKRQSRCNIGEAWIPPAASVSI